MECNTNFVYHINSMQCFEVWKLLYPETQSTILSWRHLWKGKARNSGCVGYQITPQLTLRQSHKDHLLCLKSKLWSIIYTIILIFRFWQIVHRDVPSDHVYLWSKQRTTMLQMRSWWRPAPGGSSQNGKMIIKWFNTEFFLSSYHFRSSRDVQGVFLTVPPKFHELRVPDPCV